jgi:hypothetical protein
MNSKIFLCFVPIWRFSCTRNFSKVAEVVHELAFAVCLVGILFFKQWGLLYLPVTSGGNFLVPSVLQPSRALFYPSKNHIFMSTSYWAGDCKRVQFHQH